MAGLADYKSALKAFIESQSPGSRERMLKEFTDYDAKMLEKKKNEQAKALLAEAAFESEQRAQAALDAAREAARNMAQTEANQQRASPTFYGTQLQNAQGYVQNAQDYGNSLGNILGSQAVGNYGNYVYGWSGAITPGTTITTTTYANQPTYQMWPVTFPPGPSRPAVKAGPPRIKADPPVGDRVIVFDDDV